MKAPNDTTGSGPGEKGGLLALVAVALLFAACAPPSSPEELDSSTAASDILADDDPAAADDSEAEDPSEPVGPRPDDPAKDDFSAAGSASTEAPPVGLPDPDSCRPRGIAELATAGFPLPPQAPTPVGAFRVAVLFLDFEDAPASYSTRLEASAGLPEAERYLETASYNKLDVEFIPLHRWLRSEREAGEEDVPYDIHWDAVESADPEFDFAGHDAIMVVMPSSHFQGGTAMGEVLTDEGIITAITRINAFRGWGQQGPREWGTNAAHELLHNLGLLDLLSKYPSEDQVPKAPPGEFLAWSGFGIMGLDGHFITSTQDPRLAYKRESSSGAFIAYDSEPRALEMLAWSRWQLGWLDDEQVHCTTEPETTVALAPIADPGNGIAMLAVPLSDTEAIVVESRRKIGYDVVEQRQEVDGTRTEHPALLHEGVLVYTVDAALGQYEMPLRLAGAVEDTRFDDYPILGVGQSVTVSGYTISVVDDDGDTHVVTMTKTPADPG